MYDNVYLKLKCRGVTYIAYNMSRSRFYWENLLHAIT